MARQPTEKSIAKKKLDGKKEIIRRMLENASAYEIEVVWIPRIMENQTADEVESENTHHHNGMGLSAFDAEIITSMYHQSKGGKGGVEEAIARMSNKPYEKRPSAGKRLTEKQIATARKILMKYAGQFADRMLSDFFMKHQQAPSIENIAARSVAAMSSSKKRRV
jgi:hypothetical protein